jgi:glutaredoxin 3
MQILALLAHFFIFVKGEIMTHAPITIYTTTYCPYCVRAKQLLASKGLTFKEIDVTTDPDLRVKLVEKAEGRKTVPQIFINDQPIGGFDDLSHKNSTGELDKILKPS